MAEALAGPPGGGDYSLVLHAGDLGYARGYGALWDAWLQQQQELAARVPYMVGSGSRGWAAAGEMRGVHSAMCSQPASLCLLLTVPLIPPSFLLTLQVCMGNHERDWPGTSLYGTIDSGGECGVPYSHRFPMPTSGQREQASAVCVWGGGMGQLVCAASALWLGRAGLLCLLAG